MNDRSFWVLVIIAVLLFFIAVDDGDAGSATETSDGTPHTCDLRSASSHYRDAKQTIDAGWSRRNWQDGPKKAQGQAVKEHLACLSRRVDREKIKDYLAEKKEALSLYREYRSVTPFRCHRGLFGFYAIPCYIIECESHFDWWAYNSSGASWIYQLLGWGAPRPVNFRAKLANHRIANRLWAGGSGASHWVCA